MDSVITYRRTLHRIPELDNELPKTLAFVQSRLEKLRCQLSWPIKGSVCAFFDVGRAETVAFRAEMDALPETEETGLSFASEHPGQMHACGHDGHTAIALALAEYVDSHLDDLPRNVLFIFQPAEETTGGARLICESGLLEQLEVRRIFGLHLWPDLPEGTIWAKPGPQMARASQITVNITGESVHISRAEQGRDALLAAVELVRQVTETERTALPPEDPRVLRFGTLHSGDARNVVSGHSELLGCLRTFSDASFALLRKELTDTCRRVERSTGCEVKLHLNEGYPPVWNHEGLFETVRAGLGTGGVSLLAQPALAAEDFSFYQQHIPGVFFFLGVGDVPQLHASTFSFDDQQILPKGVEFLRKLLVLA